MKYLLLSLFILYFSNSPNAQTFDLLKDYQIGQSIIYQFNRAATPAGFFQDTSSTINIFSGTYRTYIDSISFNEMDSAFTYYLLIHKVGNEIIRNVNRVISSRNIDTVYFSHLKEFINKNFGSGEHKIDGWLFPDTVHQSQRCPEDTTIFYTYPYYYKNYYFPSADTFDIRGDTLILTNLLTDCFDIGLTTTFRITTQDGLLQKIGGIFNFFDWSYTDTFTKVDVSEITGEISLPEKFQLLQNFPNPFNPITTVNYLVPKTSNVSLIIYDIIGREVVTLVNEEKPPGNYYVQFDGFNLSSGVYFLVMKADNFVDTKKLILLK